MFYPMARALARAATSHATSCSLRSNQNDIFEASDMARSARGSARAPIKLSKSDWTIKIDAFSLFDHCHSFKTHRDTES